MKALFNFIIQPKGERYNNKKEIGSKELILNTEMQNHNFVNRNAVVIEVPLVYKGPIQKSDEIIVHHNIFRRFYDVRGNEKNSASFFKEDMYFCQYDQIFLYKRDNEWLAPEGFCFVKPIAKQDKFSLDKEESLKGILKYTNSELEKMCIAKGDVVGFTPDSEYEFIIEGERLYRVQSNSISILYGHQGNEKEYNTSWATGS
jgi:hypothetical protein